MLTRLIIIRLFSNICKLAQVIPIFKNDSRLLCTNYRPISFLSNISKIFEEVILSRFLEQHNHLYPYQSGFQVDYSTNNALMTIVERIKKQLDAGNYTAGVFVELKKVFDTVDHNILLEKLDYYYQRCCKRLVSFLLRQSKTVCHIKQI